MQFNIRLIGIGGLYGLKMERQFQVKINLTEIWVNSSILHHNFTIKYMNDVKPEHRLWLYEKYKIFKFLSWYRSMTKNFFYRYREKILLITLILSTGFTKTYCYLRIQVSHRSEYLSSLWVFKQNYPANNSTATIWHHVDLSENPITCKYFILCRNYCIN